MLAPRGDRRGLGGREVVDSKKAGWVRGGSGKDWGGGVGVCLGGGGPVGQGDKCDGGGKKRKFSLQ